MVEIADFVPHAPVPESLIEEYAGRVPDELVEVWKEYGEPSRESCRRFVGGVTG